ncbi:hypothetical protein [Melghirimyces algeriensis]|uniref:hypothetical protein n=1 Tax=Melghirimyces algeriensis TaxID=910412 RepID=UPI00163D4B4D|nr:hypothetical protein [Melghirimyces algeriensis]
MVWHSAVGEGDFCLRSLFSRKEAEWVHFISSGPNQQPEYPLNGWDLWEFRWVVGIGKG